MYAHYAKTRLGLDEIRYEFKEQCCLFGCNSGIIPRMLRNILVPNQEEPFKWHIDIGTEINKLPNYLNSSLVIDLKPNQKKPNLSLYELVDVWGFSASGWTPILLRLNGLFVDEDPSLINRKDFNKKESEINGPIYEFLYLSGTIINGNLKGAWSPPPLSPTNGALLWPETLQYFVRCIHIATPEVLA